MEEWNRSLITGAILIAVVVTVSNIIVNMNDLASWIWPGLAAFYMWQYKKVYYENE